MVHGKACRTGEGPRPKHDVFGKPYDLTLCHEIPAYVESQQKNQLVMHAAFAEIQCEISQFRIRKQVWDRPDCCYMARPFCSRRHVLPFSRSCRPTMRRTVSRPSEADGPKKNTLWADRLEKQDVFPMCIFG